MTGSMLYTIGTALNLAQSYGALFEVLVEGHWLSGRVASLDGQGVVLATDGHGHSIVRIEKIAAVNVRTAAAAPASDARPQEYAESRVAALTH